MQKDTQSYSIPPAPKTARGYLSSLDVSSDYLLYFNGNTVILLPHNPQKPILNITHLTDVAAARFSNDGRLVASIEGKGTLIISEVCPDRAILVKQYENVFPNAKGLDWTADKKRICIVGEGKNLFGRVILVQTGTNAGQLVGVAGTLNSCSFRPERPYKLALGGDEFTLKFYEGPPYSFLKSDKPHSGYINQLRYSPKGTHLLSGGADRKLVLYDGVKLEKIGQKENAHNGGIFGLDWIDEDHFVTVSSDKLIKVWNIKFEEMFVIETGTPEELKNPKKIGLFLVAVRVFKDLIFAVNLEGDILTYKNPLLEKSARLQRRISGSRLKIIKILSYGNQGFISLDNGGRILYHSLKTKLTNAINTEIDIKIITDGFIYSEKQSSQLYILLEEGSVAVYSSNSFSQTLKYVKKIDKVQSKFITEFGKSNQFIGVNNDKLFIYDVSKDEVILQINFSEEATAIKSNGKYVVVGTVKGKTYIFSSDLKLIGNSEIKTFKVNAIGIIPSLVTPQTYQIIVGDSCGNMKMIQVFNNTVQVVKQTMGGHSSLITAADSDDKWIYTFSMDGRINLWNRQTIRRDHEVNEIVKGGILWGICMNTNLIVTGGDLMTKVIDKKH